MLLPLSSVLAVTRASEAVAYPDDVEARPLRLLLPVLLKDSGIVDVVFATAEEGEAGLLSLALDEVTRSEDLPLRKADVVLIKETAVSLPLPDNVGPLVVPETGSPESVASPAMDDSNGEDKERVALEAREPDVVPLPPMRMELDRVNVLSFEITDEGADAILDDLELGVLELSLGGDAVVGPAEEELSDLWV